MPKTVVHITFEHQTEAELESHIEELWDFLADDILLDEWVEEVKS